MSGISADMRRLEDATAPEARKAVDHFVFRVRRELGAMVAILEGRDAIVLRGGIGANSWRIRECICTPLGWLGVEIDQEQNKANASVISTATSCVSVFVVRTDEEAMLAEHVMEIIQSLPAQSAQMVS